MIFLATEVTELKNIDSKENCLSMFSVISVAN